MSSDTVDETMSERVALIGHPLRRRHGKLMLDAAFAACGIDAEAQLCDVAPADLASFMGSLRVPGWIGFQVTAPHKRAVMELLDIVEEPAATIGAVNTGLCRPDGTLAGFNTDAPGWRSAVADEFGVDLAGKRVVVVGAGGVAHAIVSACCAGQAAHMTVANRTEHAARGLAERFRPVARRLESTTLASPALADVLAQADLVVNATTVGTSSQVAPIDVGHCKRSCAVFDVIFDPAETELVRAARARGLHAANGMSMLVAQAAVAFERWTGHRDMQQVMAAAIEPPTEQRRNRDTPER